MKSIEELRKWGHNLHLLPEARFWELVDEIEAEVAERYMEMPLDADSEVIRVGDVMEGEKIGGGFCEPFVVVGYIMSNGELEPMDEHKLPRKHRYLHHHHEPTVEDVLREFAEKMNENIGMYTSEAIDADEWRDADNKTIAEFAAKLRLADDGEVQ